MLSLCFPLASASLPSVVWRFHSGLGLCAVHWGCVPPLALGHIFFQCPLNSQPPQTAREAGQAHAIDGEDHSCHTVLSFSLHQHCYCLHLHPWQVAGWQHVMLAWLRTLYPWTWLGQHAAAMVSSLKAFGFRKLHVHLGLAGTGLLLGYYGVRDAESL